MIRRLAAVVAAAGILLSGAAAPAGAATRPRDIHAIKGIWDSPEHDQWVFCHDLANYRGDVDYAVGDPPRWMWPAYVKRLDSCWGRKHIVHIRYNHEINGNWYPWSSKTPAQFRRDFTDFRAYVKRHSKHAISINFGLALNYTTHRYRAQDYWTPAADYVAVSFYETDWIRGMPWPRFLVSEAGPATWSAYAARNHRRLAYGEWGAVNNTWQINMRRWGAAHGVYYGAYLFCGGDVERDPDCGRWSAYLPPLR